MRLKSVEVKNYRTLEDVTFNFNGYYTAVCGKNNSGKSNLIRAMRLLFGEKERYSPFSEDIELSYKADFTAWKKDDKGIITVAGEIEANKDSDQGLIGFVEGIESEKTGLQKGTANFIFKIQIEVSDKAKSEPKVSINEIRVPDSIMEQTIYKKLKDGIIYHNSTYSHQIYFSRRRRLHGMLSRIPEANKKKLDGKASGFKKEINKVFKEQASELESMLGRLGDKLEVRLVAPELFDYDEYPFEISLGYKGFNVPLDDWGSGTRNQTLIIKSIYEAKSTAKASTVSDRITPIILIEEPESFLHPLAQAHFSGVLQEITKELKTQVITTTHSPYFLSHENPESNILLVRERAGRAKILGPSIITPTQDQDWKKPYEHALGVIGPEFDIFKAAIFSRASILIMVEGDTDKEYLELCRKLEHGSNVLTDKGEIFAYGGWSTLRNNTLLKFIRDRFSKVVLTSDLDAEKELIDTLQSLGFEKDKKYFPIGINQPGKRAIEGLLPERIRSAVQSENVGLVDALSSNDKDEVKSAKNQLKKKYLAKFKEQASIENGDYNDLYKLCRKINSAINI